MTLTIVPQILLAILVANLAAFSAFGWDKRQARRGGWRVKESTLLALALVGGTPGAFAGRALFRHKTCKQPFVTRLWFVLMLQIAASAAAGWHFFAQ
ncbi:DUF1294 domain-containing protein [Oricola sp.]|uniref:DUF1294 domain-containing protein n=1 Tax=Oricola sp. TaxID=1979950 RepID=UPI003BAB0FFD